jgi:hypothetical protein
MSYRTRKLIAVLLAIWLPLFSGSALASSVMMQMQPDACQEMGMDEHDMAPASTQCDTCDVCHLACGSYLAVQAISHPDALPAVATVTPYLFSFDSITSIPLLPPPLALV